MFLHVCPFPLSCFFFFSKKKFLFLFLFLCVFEHSLFLLSFFNFCFSFVSFFLPLLNVCHFWWFSLIWFSFVFFLLLHTLFWKNKKFGVSRLFLLSFFQREKLSFVFSPSSCFSLLQKKDFLFGCSCWLILKLPFFISSLFPSRKPFQQFPFWSVFFTSSFPPFFILCPHVLFVVSPCFLGSLTYFRPFKFAFFLFFDCLFVFCIYCFLSIFLYPCKLLQNFLFLFFSFEKLVFVCFFLLLDAFYIYFSMFLSFFLCLQKWFLVFLWTKLSFWCGFFLSSVFFDVSEKMLFFQEEGHLPCFLFLFFFLLFFFCSLAFWNHFCVWNNPIYFVTLGNVFFFFFNPFLFSPSPHKKIGPKIFILFFFSNFFHFFFIICSLFFSFINFSLWSLFSFIFLFIPFCFSHLFRAVPSWACRWFRPLVLIPFVSIEPHKFMLTLPLEWSLDTGGDVHPFTVSAEWRVGISTVTTAVIQEMRFAWAAMITLLLPGWRENTALIRCNSIAWWCARRLRRNCWSPFSYVRVPFPCSSFLWNCDGTLDSRSPYCDLSFAMIKAPWRKHWKVFSPLALCIRHRVRGVVVKKDNTSNDPFSRCMKLTITEYSLTTSA